jgi:outer membrane receptor protein involved in Fe transport
MQTSFGDVSGSANPDLRNAIRFALATGVGAAAAFNSAPAVAAEEEASAQGLEEVVVTGTRIRRVDAETANPVLTIDKEAIEQSGITTAGDLVSRIPSVSGAATNPQVNNGGGFGEANIELRGLDAKRTLILLDGRRLGLVGSSDATDVNQIPLSMIERVEVLKEGAGAIYGSDAIGGVVNFITRKDIDGLELSGDYGRTGENDGEHHSFDALFGTSTDRFKFILGGSYEKQKAVSAGNRDFSKFALYLYGGTSGIVQGGSSRTPTGRIYLPEDNSFGCGSVTRIAGAAGTSLADYRCFAGAPDRYNYQPLNLVMTPQEKVALFSKINYQINDAVELYATVLTNRRHSGYQIAPLPFDAQVDDVVLSADSIYNPFGIDFGGISGANPNFLLRMSSLGNRRSDVTSDSKILNAGLRGGLFNTGWNWDLNVTSARLDQQQTIYGYLNKATLADALGPSFIDGAGIPTCGTPDAPISGCIPVNFFNPTTADQVAALQSITANYNTNNTYRYKAASLDLTGKLWTLPGGDLMAAVGAEYNKREGVYRVDSIVQAAPPLYLTCGISNEACTGNSVGEYDSKQIYLELYAPLLKDLPAVHLLSADLGVRFSDYSLFGNATKADFKLEYRPIRDLLIRGTYSQVFRVPTITDIAASPANTSVTFNDPCTGLTSTQLAANSNLAKACEGVIPDSGFAEPNGQITGLITSNPNLKPERGNVLTYGVVFEPSQIQGLSLNVDIWRYKISDLITTLDPNYAIGQCIATGADEFCDLVTRYTSGAASGQILVFLSPTFNLGELKTNGVDFGVKYTLPNTPIGSFRFSLDVTRTGSYENVPAPGAAAQEVAGTYDRQFGNYAKLRAMGSIGWSMGDFDALLTARYIDKVALHSPAVCGKVGYSCFSAATDPEYAAANDPNDFPDWPDLKIPSFTYLDLTLGYNLPTKTRVQAGVRNLTDKQPPILYQNNVTNGNTDVQTYDAIGRRWWVSFSQKF